MNPSEASQGPLKRWITYPRILWIACLMAFLLTAPGFWMGPFMDDNFHLGILGKVIDFGGPSHLYEFANGDPEVMQARKCQGIFFWWSLPDLKVRFFRPLSCALIVMDYALFGDNFIGWHIHSALWYAAMVFFCGLLYRRILPPGAAVLALLFFALDESHWFPAVWPANRNALVASVPALAGLLAYMRWREEGVRWGLPVSLLGLSLGLMGGETALGVAAYWVSYEVFGTKGRWREKAMHTAPVALLLLAYLVIYRLGHYGTHGSGVYLDPGTETLSYALAAPARMLAIAGALLFGMPVDLWALSQGSRPILATGGTIIVLLFVWLLWRIGPKLDERTRKALRWLVPGSILSILPVAATFPSARLLLVPSIGGSMVIALVLQRCYFLWTAGASERARRSKHFLGAALGLSLVFIHGVLPPVVWTGSSVLFTRFRPRVERAFLQAPIAGRNEGVERNILLVAPDPITAVYTPLVRILHLKTEKPDPWLILSLAPYAHRLTRIGENTLEMDVVDGCMLRGEFERLMRSPAYPIKKGEQFDLCGIVVTVLEVAPDGPTRIGVQFDHSLDSTGYRFLIWRGDGMERFTMPKIGDTVLIPREMGLVKLPFIK